MRPLFVILIMLSYFDLNAQENEKRLIKGDVTIKYCPTSLMDIGFPRIEFGGTYMFDNKLGLQLKIGKKVDIFHPEDELKNDGFKLAFEYQYYIFRKLYVAVENGIIKNRFTDEMTYLVSSGSTNGIDDEYHVTDEKLFVVPKAGFLLFIGNYLIIDFYGGFGLEFANRTVRDLEYNPDIGNVDPAFYEWFGPNYHEKREYGLRLTLGINIALRLN